MSDSAVPDSRVVRAVACPGCGCLCDDVELTVAGGVIRAARKACPVGEAWFRTARPEERPEATVEGQPVAFDVAVDRAARILGTARRPLVTGLHATTCEAQRAAVSLADRLGACVDPLAADGAEGLAFQDAGAVRCSLGEVRNRADFVLFWGGDPSTTHPRHHERYSPRRADRTVAVVASEPAGDADLSVALKPGQDFELLWALRARVKGIDLAPASFETLGVSPETLEDLVTRMKASRFGVIFYGAQLTAGGRRCVEALVRLVQDLNAVTRFAALPLGGPGNLAGADNVLTWQTGYSHAVDLSRGYPRFDPDRFGAAGLLARGEADAVLLVGSAGLDSLTPAARNHLARIPTVALDPEGPVSAFPATVAFTTATYGIHTAGTVFRVDGIALPLRPPLPSRYPDDVTVLRAIEDSLTKSIHHDPV